MVIDWPGSRSVYGESVYETVEQMADAVLKAAADMDDAARHADKIAAMQTDAASRFDIARTIDQLEEWFG